MAGLKFWAHGTVVQIGTIEIEGIESIGLPDESKGDVPVTDADDNGNARYIGGLREGGSLTLNLRKIPGAAGQEALRANFEGNANAEFTITLPASATDDSDVAAITFDGYVNGWGGDLPQVENTPATLTVSIKVDGITSETLS